MQQCSEAIHSSENQTAMSAVISFVSLKWEYKPSLLAFFFSFIVAIKLNVSFLETIEIIIYCLG